MSTADGIALFDQPAANVNDQTVPVDAVIYGGENTNNLLDESGEAGDVDGYANTSQSLERTPDGWRVQETPTPNDCSALIP